MSKYNTRERIVDIEVEVRAKTDRGVKVFDGTREVWLPLSQVEIHKEKDKTIASMPEWLAIEKELV